MVFKFTVVLMRRGIFELLDVVISNGPVGELHVAKGFFGTVVC
jgi:hypothetical protein